MNHTPTFVKCTDKQLMSFRKIALKNADTLAVDINGQDDAKELHAKRSELRKIANNLLNISDKEKRNMNETENEAWNVISCLLDDIQCAFDAKQERTFANESINRVNGIGNMNSNRSLETWQDVKTGKAIPVLGKEHRFADHIQKSGNDISSRDYFASLVGHPVSREAREALGTGNDVKGGFMVPEQISAEIIDLLRAKNVCIAAGARTMPMDAQTVRVCRVDSDPAASWVGENSLIPDTDMSIGAVDFVAHKLTCLIKVSRELLQDASNAAHVIQNAIAVAMAASLDSAALNGTGAGQPLGIYNNSHICTYSLGVDGHTLNGYDDLLHGIKEIITVNGPIPNTAVMSPRTLIGYSLLKDGDGKPLQRADIIKDMQFLDTSKMPVNETQGASGAVCSSIILGGFESLVIGIRSVLELQVLNERYADFGQMGFLATMRADTAVYEPKAFCKIIGIKP